MPMILLYPILGAIRFLSAAALGLMAVASAKALRDRVGKRRGGGS